METRKRKYSCGRWPLIVFPFFFFFFFVGSSSCALLFFIFILMLFCFALPAHTRRVLKVGWVSDADATVTLMDSWSATYDQPVSDTSLRGTQGVSIVAAMQVNKTTTIMFSRKLQSSDIYDYNITATPFYLLFGYGASDGFGAAYAKHVEASSAKVNFFITNGSALYVPTTTTLSPSNPTTPRSNNNNNNNNISSLGVNSSAPMFTSPDGVMKVWWQVMPSHSSNITFTVAVSSLGWFSVGLNTVPFMTNADDYVVSDNGRE